MSATKTCCADCFGDRGLKRSIIPSLSTVRGDCSFCGSRAVELVLPFQLNAYFGLLVSIYEFDENGQQLVDWLKQDWDMFHHPSMDVHKAKDLLGEVLDDGEIVRQTFSPSPKYQSEGLKKWENLRAELMHENRYFPKEHLDTDRLEQLLGHLIADELPEKWYRSRLLTGDIAFTIDEMGAPPKRVASHGRANPAGIPYLYLGSTPETAVSETRPHTGENACVSDFVIKTELKIVDLRNPRRLVSPFVLTDEEEIGLLRSDIAFLERLGEELTRPIAPQGAPFDYVPSQYLCEFIKKTGYAGVIYRSSVSTGINLALFRPELAIPGKVEKYAVNRVTVDVKPIAF